MKGSEGVGKGQLTQVFRSLKRVSLSSSPRMPLVAPLHWLPMLTQLHPLCGDVLSYLLSSPTFSAVHFPPSLLNKAGIEGRVRTMMVDSGNKGNGTNLHWHLGALQPRLVA